MAAAAFSLSASIFRAYGGHLSDRFGARTVMYWCFGFSLIFASPAPLTTVRYCVPIHHRQGSNQISRFSWQIIEPVEA